MRFWVLGFQGFATYPNFKILGFQGLATWVSRVLRHNTILRSWVSRVPRQKGRARSKIHQGLRPWTQRTQDLEPFWNLGTSLVVNIYSVHEIGAGGRTPVNPLCPLCPPGLPSVWRRCCGRTDSSRGVGVWCPCEPLLPPPPGLPSAWRRCCGRGAVRAVSPRHQLSAAPAATPSTASSAV